MFDICGFCAPWAWGSFSFHLRNLIVLSSSPCCRCASRHLLCAWPRGAMHWFFSSKVLRYFQSLPLSKGLVLLVVFLAELSLLIRASCEAVGCGKEAGYIGGSVGGNTHKRIEIINRGKLKALKREIAGDTPSALWGGRTGKDDSHYRIAARNHRHSTGLPPYRGVSGCHFPLPQFPALETVFFIQRLKSFSTADTQTSDRGDTLGRSWRWWNQKGHHSFWNSNRNCWRFCQGQCFVHQFLLPHEGRVLSIPYQI